jgi:hypothetical protein
VKDFLYWHSENHALRAKYYELVGINFLVIDCLTLCKTLFVFYQPRRIKLQLFIDLKD